MRPALLVLLTAAVVAVLLAEHSIGGGWFDALLVRRDALLGWRADHPAPAVLAYCLCVVAATALMLPIGVVAMVAAGSLFGWWPGALLASACLAVGATGAMLLSRRLLRDAWRSRMRHRQPSGPPRTGLPARLEVWRAGFERATARHGRSLLLSLRLVPAMPFPVVNLLMGLTSMPVRTFFWIGWLGSLPSVAIYSAAGSRLATVHAPHDVLSPEIAGLLCAAAAMPWLMRAAKRLRRR